MEKNGYNALINKACVFVRGNLFIAYAFHNWSLFRKKYHTGNTVEGIWSSGSNHAGFSQ